MKKFMCLAIIGSIAVAGCQDNITSSSEPSSSPALSSALAPLAIHQISTGREHTCGVATDGRAYCWGSSEAGQLGNNVTDGPDECAAGVCSKRPVAVAGGHRFKHVSSGWFFTCGLGTDDRGYCWGSNAEGQLGIGVLSNRRTSPVGVLGGLRFLQVRAGSSHACGITLVHAAFCWGDNLRGQLGNGTTNESLTPVPVTRALHWRQLSAGWTYTCGVTMDDLAYCWGDNRYGQLGDGTTSRRLRPTLVAGGLHFRQIDAGLAHTCAVTSSGDRAYCWGTGLGVAGDKTTNTIHLTPTAVAILRRFANVTAGSGQSCGTTMSGLGFCWGANGAGQLGDGTTMTRIRPFALAVQLNLDHMSAGHGFTCGVTVGDRAYCWGAGESGQLGDGSDVSHLIPTAVVGP